MTKELELFKRWFDITEREYDLIKYDKINICKDKPWVAVPIHLINSLGFLNDENYPFCSVFKIPPQYHSEWEQYVKEKELVQAHKEASLDAEREAELEGWDKIKPILEEKE